MKKTFKIVSAVLLLVFALTGCGTKSVDGVGKDTALTDEISLKRLEVYSNAVNPEQIYHISYPYYFYAFTTDSDGSVRSGLFDLTDPIPSKELAEREMKSEYYAAVKELLIESYRPGELVLEDSTEEEYEAFLSQFFEKIGADNVIEEESDQEYFRRFYLSDTGKYFYTARTVDTEKLPVRKRNTDDYYCMELDAHMEDMVMETDFIYSADHKYILVPMENDPDMMIAFCE